MPFTPENNKLALLSMLEAIQKIEKFSSDLETWQDLKNDLESFDACLLNFVIIGEMVLRLEPDFMSSHPEIEWHKIRGFRNLVAHDYFGIDPEEVWGIIENKIPQLKTFITKFIEQ
ncbi:MAG: hypothetical protein POELPBGB_01947 [Bacteroidia bacterium]|nr:hypothetical protein [Bacteroidia bacterium]